MCSGFVSQLFQSTSSRDARSAQLGLYVAPFRGTPRRTLHVRTGRTPAATESQRRIPRYTR